ncbi:MAG: hypothetical protein K2J67_12210 [Lachnospiraceae bacterium]|nr:hypothetical protein [Lachnospiraceae bacterium]
MDMEQDKYWKRFTSSGRVEDYLAYRNVSGWDTQEQSTDRGREEDERHCDSDWYDRPVITNTRI